MRSSLLSRLPSKFLTLEVRQALTSVAYSMSRLFESAGTFVKGFSSFLLRIMSRSHMAYRLRLRFQLVFLVT